MAKIVVGMSGGVDSAVSAFLLKQQGHEVVGVFMRNWDSFANNDILGNPNVDASVCPEEQDWADVQEVGKQLEIETIRVDFVKEYWDNVFEDLIKVYKEGRTPNPDILCNKYVKFGAFLDWVEKNIPDFDFVAMGHYAKTENGYLMMPKDSWKDQTYFLAQLSKKQLAKVIFPLSDLLKSEVRKIAAENNLIIANKKDSTGICFIGERNFTDFLKNYIPSMPGDIIDITTNKIVGKHVGAMYYTIGQRKGLHLGGMNEPYYVCGHNIEKKIIYVAPNSRPEYLYSNSATITDVNWIMEGYTPKNLKVKFRYKSDFVEASMTFVSSDEVVVEYPKGFEAVTPGQQCVFYDGEFCLGGGVIDKVYSDKVEKTYL